MTLYTKEYYEELARWWALEAEALRIPGTIEHEQREPGMVRICQDQAAEYQNKANELQAKDGE